ncbi:MAG: T9SS type A sorting domain-containing protein [Bacteroidetes bacterium]|nr:T9SS type A sorting domain-containing protein [Bacteroidota bacterium]
MKLFKRILGLAVCVALVGTLAGQSHAQIWADFNMGIENAFYNPLPNGTVINILDFKTFAGVVDLDDGVANDVPTGFTFDYNGNSYNTVNVCVNGWATVGHRDRPVITHDKYYIFLPNEPNNTLAPFFGDHIYRTLADKPAGYTPTVIWYTTNSVPDPNPNAAPGSFLHTFILEWKNLNINDKSNPNSIATFQIQIVENSMANDLDLPDHRATIQFHYGPIGNLGNVKTQGCTVGIDDSTGYSFMNGLFPSLVDGENPARTNTDSLTTCWPPASCLPGRVISFDPEGRGTLAQWGDGDADLTQLTSFDPKVVNNQNRFVTIADADLILGATAQAYPPLDSVEGRNAFHGDCNHNGQYQNPQFAPYFFYRVTPYDAAYILTYLAAKIPFLPWLHVLPSWKEAAGAETNIASIQADVKQAVMNDRTIMVPLVLHGSVNGAVSLECNVASNNPSALEFAGTQTKVGMIYGNAKSGKVAFAATGQFAEGDVLGYLEFVSNDTHVPTSIELNNISINDQAYPAQRSALEMDVTSASATNFSVEKVAPNPFSVSADAATTVHFSMSESNVVTAKIFDLLGKEVRTITAGQTFSAGSHSIQWDGHDNSGAVVPAGVYYYNLSAGSSVLVGKINLMQ